MSKKKLHRHIVLHFSKLRKKNNDANKISDKNENGKSCIDVIIIQCQLQWNMLLIAATDRAMDLP